MPLHDWKNEAGWSGVHLLWIAELLRWIKPRLPNGYRVYIGSAPIVAFDAPTGTDDADGNGVSKPQGDVMDWETEVAVATLDPGKTVFVEKGGRLVAAIELISPRNKDRPSARTTYLGRYISYLMDGVHLLLVDVLPHPLSFSFLDGIARELGYEQPRMLPPAVVSYRVGEPAPEGGRLLGIWRRTLQVGEALPTAPLALSLHDTVQVDLENTYMRAAEAAYLT